MAETSHQKLEVLLFLRSGEGLTSFIIKIAVLTFLLEKKGKMKFSGLCIQLFRERLSEKVHATIPKGIVGGFEFTVLQR